MCEHFDWKPIEIIVAALTAIGTLAVAVLAIWGDWFRAKFAPGKLAIEIHNLTGDLTHLKLPNGGLMHTYFFHLKIVNKRHWISPKNCRVLLQAMSKRGPDNEFHPIPMAVPLQFVWAPAEITPPVVTIHHKQILDFGIMTEGEQKFVPKLYSYSNNFRGVIAAGEAIRYSLEIVSDAYVSEKYQVFEVAFDGVWSANPTEMQNHLRIREIIESPGYD